MVPNRSYNEQLLKKIAEAELIIIPLEDFVQNSELLYGIDGWAHPPRPLEYDTNIWNWRNTGLAFRHTVSLFKNDPLAWLEEEGNEEPISFIKRKIRKFKLPKQAESIFYMKKPVIY